MSPPGVTVYAKCEFFNPLSSVKDRLALGVIDYAEKEGLLQPNGQKVPEPTFDVAHVASAVLQMAELPLDTNIQFMTIMARDMPFIGRG